MTLASSTSTRLNLLFRKVAVIGFSGIATLMLSVSAQANNLIVNGGFETTTLGPAQFDNNTQATGWASGGYNFIFGAGTADTTGSNGQYGVVSLWGPNNGSANGLPAASPDGGNFVAADGAFGIAPINQTVSGLVAGQQYNLSFFWAGAQQFGFTGATTEQWRVTFGGDEQDTAVLNNLNHGFTGWQQETFKFTAHSTSQVLSFLAVGTPDGEPPFSLLDGVSLNATAAPEPGAVSLMLGGLMCGIGMIKFRKRTKK